MCVSGKTIFSFRPGLQWNRSLPWLMIQKWKKHTQLSVGRKKKKNILSFLLKLTLFLALADAV